ncbi:MULTISPECIES: LysR family transcriptional regulator [Pseudoxanthomonas]|uniref:LysR family nod box-dependent transcriptional activator n=1 Tax=Pseudoxanthomonas winnipegensis TaxID=2480810 RepID=A0AAW8GFD6_9GAMM|nr:MULTISPECIES: LysR family transcriptional regulator [Pseudoxanthomonas]MDQ1120476.1 LysR family nod box-dependent transcriptional activator [Pseudoxanthomonas winnipegensis]MDQ1133695.1 LysR family nod box-dependent transcriptional activator [Pseudoxanthomonas winnipegensis]MDR6140064.1 LysR family nod box-dependent transcriptional activator [Pseudoxanthomonas sp. SORGH_AS_0997]
MRFKKLDLNLLAALDTLLRTRSVSQAASEMFLTQSAMSNALARLRSHFDDPLLVQVGRKMELSPLAETLQEPLRDIMVRIEMAMEITPNFSSASSNRHISIILSDYTLYTVAPPFLREVARQAPGMTIELKPQTALPYLMLERGEADLVIAPDRFRSAIHPAEALLTDPLCCLVAAESKHPLKRFDAARFESAGHVVMQPPSGSESYAVQACREAGLQIREEVSTYSFASIGDLVKGTDRIAVTQQRLAQKLISEKGGLRMVAPPLPLRPMQQDMLWHIARTHDPALAWLRKLFRAVADA